jgi:hypothetical protein
MQDYNFAGGPVWVWNLILILREAHRVKLRFKVFMVVAMKNDVFWHVTACGSNVVLSSRILVALMMEAIRCSEISVFTTATLRNISADGILHRLNVFENRVLRPISVLKRDEVAAGPRNLHNDEPSIIRIIMSRRIK